MISEKLKTFYLVSVILFIIHGIEEYFTGLYDFDSFYQFFSDPKWAFIVVILISSNLLLILSYRFGLKNKFGLWFASLLGLVLIYELQHIVVSFSHRGYTPGLISALAFPIIGFLFWKELLNNFKNRYARS